MPPSIYIAVSPADSAIADVLQVYLEHAGIHCVRRDDVQVLLDFVRDLQMTMKNCTAIVVIDSLSFREETHNWELYYAQRLENPLVVVSLESPLDEANSTERVKLIDFTTPQARDWHRLLESIVTLLNRHD